MTNNPILEELHETRERMLAEAGGTMEGLVARLQQDERLSGCKFVPPRSRTTRCPVAALSGLVAEEKQLTSPGDR